MVASSLQSQMAASIHVDDVQHDCISRLRHSLGEGSSSSSQIVIILAPNLKTFPTDRNFCSFDTDADPHNAVRPFGISRKTRA